MGEEVADGMYEVQRPVIVVAPGGNDVVIPVTVYPDMDTAVRELTSLLGIEPMTTPYTWMKNMYGDGCTAWVLSEKHTGKDERGQYIYLQDRLFSSYYDGCGPCIDIIAFEIEWGQLKVFPFNLD
jgi:hypothetical protein